MSSISLKLVRPRTAPASRERKCYRRSMDSADIERFNSKTSSLYSGASTSNLSNSTITKTDYPNSTQNETKRDSSNTVSVDYIRFRF